jgi:hypothetical protein
MEKNAVQSLMEVAKRAQKPRKKLFLGLGVSESD